VNLLCDRALQVGRVERVKVIGPELVTRAARSLAGGAGTGSEAPKSQRPDADKPADPRPMVAPRKPTRPRRRRRLWLAAGILTVLAAGTFAYGFYGTRILEADPEIPAVPPAPARPVGDPPAAVPTPTEAEWQQYLLELAANPRGEGG
jgi:hypothetical protein